MNKLLICAVLIAFLSTSALQINAQTKKKGKKTLAVKKSNNVKSPIQQVTAPAGDVGVKKVQSNIPYINISSSGGTGNGINDTVKVSLRNDNIIERNLVKDRTPLAYKNIREDDAVYKQRIWREIDSREKINLPFRYSLVEDNGSQRFVSILINAIKNGVTAFDPIDDRFTTPLTTQQAIGTLSSGKPDTIPVSDLDGNIVKYNVMTKEPSLDSVYKFLIKEEVVFDKETSRLYTRILGICPEMPITLSDGTSLGQMRRLFWLYYPDLRPTLAKYEVYNPKNFGARMSWEDLFESRMFSSYIIKSTINNPFDQSLKEKYGKNTLFVLLEGDAIKDKIFNYEQSLWSY